MKTVDRKFHQAIYEDDLKTVQTLIGQFSELNQPDEYGNHCLYWPAFRGQTKLVSLLLVAGADPNQPSQSGTTPIHEASIGGHVEVVALLLEAGADPNRPGVRGVTPVCRASVVGYPPVVLLLLERGAVPPAQSRFFHPNVTKLYQELDRNQKLQKASLFSLQYATLDDAALAEA